MIYFSLLQKMWGRYDFMEKLQTKKQVNALAILLTVTYMISYITRINYGAIISEMVEATKISKSMLSMALTGSFITYGTGQVVSGILGDRFSPKKLVFWGLVASICMNLLIPVCNSPYQMLVVWCINGFAQSFMWPPIVRIMTEQLSEDDYKTTCTKVSWGSSFGTIVVYLCSPLLITLAGWKSVFVFSAIAGIIMLFIWNKKCADIKGGYKKTVQSQKGSMNNIFTPLMIMIMLAIVLQGMLRDGVTTWMPSYIFETYNLSNVISILTGVILPLFSILSFQAATKLYMNKLKNPMLCAGVFFGAGAVSALLLTFVTGKNAAFSVLLSALLTGCMHGVNLLLICMIPPFFKKYGNVSTVSGVLNSCTYIGSAISTYGIALLSEKLGWGFTLFGWLLIAALGTLICLVCVKPWSKEHTNND